MANGFRVNFFKVLLFNLAHRTALQKVHDYRPRAVGVRKRTRTLPCAEYLHTEVLSSHHLLDFKLIFAFLRMMQAADLLHKHYSSIVLFCRQFF